MSDQDEKVSEVTTSAAIPDIIGSFALRKRKFPATLSGVVDKLRRYKKRLAQRYSKHVSPPNPPIV